MWSITSINLILQLFLAKIWYHFWNLAFSGSALLAFLVAKFWLNIFNLPFPFLISFEMEKKPKIRIMRFHFVIRRLILMRSTKSFKRQVIVWALYSRPYSSAYIHAVSLRCRPLNNELWWPTCSVSFTRFEPSNKIQEMLHDWVAFRFVIRSDSFGN